MNKTQMLTEVSKVIVQEQEALGGEWEPDFPTYPTLLKSALYGVAGEFVELASENSEADPAAILATFLVRWGIEIGRGPYFRLGDGVERAVENAVIVAPSSKGRKGTSAKPIDKLFSSLSLTDEIYTPCRTSPGPLSSGEGLVFAVRDEQREWIVDKKSGGGKWIVKDPGVDDKRLFVLDEEFSAALACTKREGNTLSAIIRRLFDGGDVDPLTKTSKTKTTGAHIGILTHITQAELQKALSENEMLNGFGNRFLWVFAKRHRLVPFPQPMDEKRLNAIRMRIMNTCATVSIDNDYMLDHEARELWSTVYPTLSRDHSGLVGCLINRAETHVLRLALLYSTLDGKEDIRVSHLQAALAFWDYCETSAKFVFGDREADPLSEKILVILKSGPKTTTELYNATGRNYSQPRMRSSINTLLAADKILVQRDNSNQGRPKNIFQLNEKNEFNEERSLTYRVNSFNSFNSDSKEKKIGSHFHDCPNNSEEVEVVL